MREENGGKDFIIKQQINSSERSSCAGKAGPRRSLTKWIFRLVSAAVILLCAVWSCYGYRTGLFTSTEALQTYISGFGVWAALIFVLMQTLQVIVPILPGGVACVVGVLLFGPWMGFLYNYIGMCAGSVCVFALSRRFGRPIMEHLFSEKTIAKYESWTETQTRFPKFFAAAIALPGMPDDFLCCLAGLTKLSWRQFLLIVFLGRPITLAAYSFGFYTIID